MNLSCGGEKVEWSTSDQRTAGLIPALGYVFLSLLRDWSLTGLCLPHFLTVGTLPPGGGGQPFPLPYTGPAVDLNCPRHFAAALWLP